MRLPTNKVYRAFPEFDRLSDAACEKYIRAARYKQGSLSRRCASIAISTIGIVAVYVLSMLCVYGVLWIVLSIFEGFGIVRRGSSAQAYVIRLVSLVLALFVPTVLTLMLRDSVLRRKIRAQLQKTTCKRCGYNLLGIPITGSGPICPECGEQANLDELSPETATALRASSELAGDRPGAFPRAALTEPRSEHRADSNTPIHEAESMVTADRPQANKGDQHG